MIFERFVPETPDPIDFDPAAAGILLSRRRTERGMSRVDAAAALGIHENTIMRWERGNIPSTFLNFLEYVHGLGISHDELLETLVLIGDRSES